MNKVSSLKSGKSKKTDTSRIGITYITKEVDTSITLLASPEDAVVLDALIYLWDYASIQESNLIYIQKCGLLQKLLNLLDRNAKILLVALKFLELLLSIEEVILELNQDTYDRKIIEISDVFVTNGDRAVKQICVSILAKLTDSFNVVSLIFNTKLFTPIVEIMAKNSDVEFLEPTLELLLRLVGALAAALEALPDSFDFDVSILMNFINSPEQKIRDTAFKIIEKLTFYNLDVFQNVFKSLKLVEIMLEVVMDENKLEYHQVAIDVVKNSMKSNETCDYFIESLEFLKFCQWVKTCDEKYHLDCISLLEQLTRIPSRRQILFDFSVEESILSFFRSMDEKVLSKTCEAVTHMVAHKYCCEAMLTPELMKQLFQILASKCGEDVGDEIALKAIVAFNRNNLNALSVIHSTRGHRVLIEYFKRGIGYISEGCFLEILEILYKMSLCPELQGDIASTSFFQKLLELFEMASADTARSACEIMVNFVQSAEFTRYFLSLNGPHSFMETVRHPKDPKLLKIVLIFIYNCLVHQNVLDGFLQNDLVEGLKQLPPHLKAKMPIAEKILRLVYKQNLPLKFFETNRLDMTDKLENKFYLINGHWNDKFPLLKDLEKSPLTTEYAVYVVDYSCELKYDEEASIWSESISSDGISSERTISTLSKASSSPSTSLRMGHFNINYGKLTVDPFLSMYIRRVSKFLDQSHSLEVKVKALATYVDAVVGELQDKNGNIDKVHHIKLHLEILKHRLGTNLIPVGFLRLGGLCERALLFKATADKVCIPTSLVRGNGSFYWNEVLLLDSQLKNGSVKPHVVDLTRDVGNLLVVGSRAANTYCNITAWKG